MELLKVITEGKRIVGCFFEPTRDINHVQHRTNSFTQRTNQCNNGENKEGEVEGGGWQEKIRSNEEVSKYKGRNSSLQEFTL